VTVTLAGPDGAAVMYSNPYTVEDDNTKVSVTVTGLADRETIHTGVARPLQAAVLVGADQAPDPSTVKLRWNGGPLTSDPTFSLTPPSNGPGTVSVQATVGTHTSAVMTVQYTATAGPITVAGGNGSGGASNQLASPYQVAVGPDGTLYIADAGNDRVVTWAAGAPAGNDVLKSPQVAAPRGVVMSADGTMYVADSSHSRVLVERPGQAFTTFGSETNVGPLALYEPAGRPATLYEMSSLPGQPVLACPVAGGSCGQLNGVTRGISIAVDPTGTIYVVDIGANRVMKCAPGGTTFVPAFTGSVDSGASAVAADGRGDIYVGFADGHVAVIANGIATTIFSGSQVLGLTLDGPELYVAQDDGTVTNVKL
jgi:prepilin-type processing-associated H-X9-DG protein